MSALLTDAVEHGLCEGVIDQFLPLTADELPPGPEAGEVAIEGRWWLQRCEMERADERLRVRVGGPLWIWVDEESAGFALNEYVYFEANAEVAGSLSLGYDGERKVASVWFTPDEQPEVEGGRTAEVTPEVRPLGAVLTILTLGAAKAFADDKAREQVETEIPRRFEEQMRRGVTVTFDVRTGQADMHIGMLGQGVVPTRPFPVEEPFLVNERQTLQPSPRALHVIGPFDTAHGRLDLRVEQGPGVRYRAACVEHVRRWVAPVVEGNEPQIPEPRDGEVAGVARGGETSVTLALDCPFYVITRPLDAPVTLSLRVATEDEAKASAAAPEDAERQSAPSQRRSTMTGR